MVVHVPRHFGLGMVGQVGGFDIDSRHGSLHLVASLLKMQSAWKVALDVIDVIWLKNLYACRRLSCFFGALVMGPALVCNDDLPPQIFRDIRCSEEIKK